MRASNQKARLQMPKTAGHARLACAKIETPILCQRIPIAIPLQCTLCHRAIRACFYCVLRLRGKRVLNIFASKAGSAQVQAYKDWFRGDRIFDSGAMKRPGSTINATAGPNYLVSHFDDPFDRTGYAVICKTGWRRLPAGSVFRTGRNGVRLVRVIHGNPVGAQTDSCAHRVWRGSTTGLACRRWR